MLRLIMMALAVALTLVWPLDGFAQAVEDASREGESGRRQDQVDAAPAGQPPVSMDRIRQGLFAVPALKLPTDLPAIDLDETAGRPTFRLEVFGQPPSLQNLFEGVDLSGGPVPRGPATHAEFLAMVTPQELYSSAGINALELFTAGLSAKAIEWMVTRAVADARERAKQEELERTQQQIDRELREIERHRQQQAPPDQRLR